MDANFGNSRDEQGYSELNKPENGIIRVTDAAVRFPKGYFVLLPDVADYATLEEIQDWDVLKAKTTGLEFL